MSSISSFSILCVVMIAGQKPADLKKRAKSEDEGIVIVVLIILATMAFFCDAVFIALHKKHGLEPLPLVLARIGAPLGWLVLHTVMAFHYADIHYFDDPDCADDESDLDFPARGDPGPWDFLYYSFVVGMTCQVSRRAGAAPRRCAGYPVPWRGVVLLQHRLYRHGGQCRGV